ncbi:MAG: HlyD family efflux transporter periplasmic adaptor subunit [Bacillota bacterium]|nr:HlyD family efflux transporter periplasmic adaptor subunit [Bacillota bacterium]
MSRRKVVLSLVVLALVAGGAVLAGRYVAARRQQEGIPVEVSRAQRGQFAVTAIAEGVVEAEEVFEIRSPVSGRVARVPVQEGDLVRAGQVIAWLDAAERRARVEQLRAEWEEAQLVLAEAERNLERQQRLYAAQAATRQELEEASQRVATARVRLRAAEERYRAEAFSQAGGAGSADPLQGWAPGAGGRSPEDSGSARLDGERLLAPVGGTAVAVKVKGGEALAVGQPLLTLADLGRLVVTAKVDEVDVARMAVGQEATVTSDALPEVKFSGYVWRIAPAGAVEGNVTRFPVKIRIGEAQAAGSDGEGGAASARGGSMSAPGPAGALRPGMSARAEVVTYRRPDAVFIPLQAVVERQVKGKETSVVFVVEDGRARQVVVARGRSNDTAVEILSGLQGGEEVVVGPYQTLRRLKDGDRVRTSKAGAG